MILVRINVNRNPQSNMERNNKFIQIVWFDMKHITFIQILKSLGNAIGKMQTSEGRGSKQIDAMPSDEGRGDAPFI